LSSVWRINRDSYTGKSESYPPALQEVYNAITHHEQLTIGDKDTRNIQYFLYNADNLRTYTQTMANPGDETGAALAFYTSINS
jgi:hypothetical protein